MTCNNLYPLECAFPPTLSIIWWVSWFFWNILKLVILFSKKCKKGLPCGQLCAKLEVNTCIISMGTALTVCVCWPVKWLKCTHIQWQWFHCHNYQSSLARLTENRPTAYAEGPLESDRISVIPALPLTNLHNLSLLVKWR